MTHLDLFSGIGGFAIAAQRCGYTTIGFCEKELYAQQILKERFGAVLADAEHNGLATSTGGNRRSEQDAGREKESSGTKQPSGSYRKPQLHPDIFTLNGADYAGVDLLTGGFPCQPFSVAGQRRGAADDRAIWPEMLRVINEARPRWLIGENVAGIITMELDNILSDLESLGYSAWPIVVPAASVDARHLRQRVWIIGRRDVGDTEHNGHTATKISGSNPSGSDCDQTGKEQAVELERSGEQYEDVADSESGEPRKSPEREGWEDSRGGGGDCRGSETERAEDVGDTAREGLSERGRPERNTSNAEAGTGVVTELERSGEDVADTDDASCQGNERTQRGEQERAEHQQHRGRQSQSSVRRVADGLSEGLDGGGTFCQWPEEDPGTPRVSTGVKHRAHRLRGLGNAIVPQVAEEIIRSIVLTSH